MLTVLYLKMKIWNIKNMGCSATLIYKYVCVKMMKIGNYLPNPLWVLWLGTDPWRNSCFEFRRTSWFPAIIVTPSLVFLERGSACVEETDMENSTGFDP